VITGILVSSLRIKNSATPWAKWKNPASLLKVWSCLPNLVTGFMTRPFDDEEFKRAVHVVATVLV
jgi:hypothetical protein